MTAGFSQVILGLVYLFHTWIILISYLLLYYWLFQIVPGVLYNLKGYKF